jgi:homocysteine S-methyltransferase
MPPLVVGSVGPYGAALHDGSEYRGDYASTVSEEQLMAWHRPRLQALNQAGIRLLAVETIPALSEAKAVLRLLKSEFPHLRAWISFSCKVGTQKKLCASVMLNRFYDFNIVV